MTDRPPGRPRPPREASQVLRRPPAPGDARRQPAPPPYRPPRQPPRRAPWQPPLEPPRQPPLQPPSQPSYAPPHPPPLRAPGPPRQAPPAQPPRTPPAAAPHQRTPPPAAPRRRPRDVRRWGRRLRRALTLAVVLLVLGAGAGAIWADRAMTRVAVFTGYAERPGVARGTTWLLVGSDSRADLTPDQQAELATGGEVGNGRTDTILLVHLPALGSGTPATLVSLPRDSYVPIPAIDQDGDRSGGGRDKINAAFAEGGPPLLARTVEEATGLRLDHYAQIGFGGFAELVDAVGGVPTCPTDPIADPLAGVDLPAGCQTLDGRTALGYVRSRATPRADLDRMINQRRFVGDLVHRAASPAVWVDPLRWYPMLRAARDTVTVDEGTHLWDLVRLGWALRDAVSTTVPIGEFTASDSGSVVVWDHDAASRLFTALGEDDPVPTDSTEPAD